MSRSLSTEQKNAAASSQYRALYFAKFDGADPFLVWQGIGEFVDGDDTYIGADGNLVLQNISENLDLGEEGFDVSLSGFNNDVKALLGDVDHANYTCTLKLGIFDENWDLIGDLFTVKQGVVSHMASTSTRESTTISATISSNNFKLSRSLKLTHSDTDQRSLHPGDTIFVNMAANSGRVYTWKG